MDVDEGNASREAAAEMINAANSEGEETTESSETPAVEETATETPAVHPAIDEFLQQFPETLRPTVAPKLQEWQKKFDENLRQVHSQYEPFKGFLDNKVDPADLRDGVALLTALRANPRAVFDQLAAHYRFAVEQGQEDQQEESATELQEDDPRILELQRTQEQMQQMLQAQYQEKQMQEADAEISAMFEEYGKTRELDDDATKFITQTAYALTQSYPDAPFKAVMDAAVGEWDKLAAKFAPKPVAPSVPRGTSSLPSTANDLGSLEGKDRKAAALELAKLLNGNGS